MPFFALEKCSGGAGPHSSLRAESVGAGGRRSSRHSSISAADMLVGSLGPCAYMALARDYRGF